MYVHIFQRHHKRSFARSTDYLSTNSVYTQNKSDKPQSNIYFYQFVTVDSHTVSYINVQARL